MLHQIGYQGETRRQLTYSWRSHPQVSHQRLPMDGGGAGGGGGGGGSWFNLTIIMVGCLVFLSFRNLFALKPLALKGLCHLWKHSMVSLFFELESTSPDTHTHTRCFLWVKGALLFACKPSHHSISQTFSTFYARKLYSPWPPLIFRSIMLLGYYCHTTLWA
jgi:hypothetical protein